MLTEKESQPIIKQAGIPGHFNEQMRQSSVRQRKYHPLTTIEKSIGSVTPKVHA